MAGVRGLYYGFSIHLRSIRIGGIRMLYNLLLAVLGFTCKDIPRFRDCYLSDGNIVIYTRTGGGNRDYYENLERAKAVYSAAFSDDEESYRGPWNDDMRRHACFLYDRDDDLDCTCAYFYFRYPADLKEDLEILAKWQALSDGLSAVK